jgi:SAM-dependent methyltransferase
MPVTREQLLDKLVEIDSGDYATSHYDRFIESYLFIAPHLKSGDVCLDLGSYGHFQKLVQAFHPDVQFPNERNDFDLRYPFPIDSGKYDFVFCMEVIEHIKDQNENGDIELLAEFNQSGVHNLMAEIKRILKHSGKLFLTTPNINSWMSAHRLLSMYSPTFYLPHNKEFSIQEMYALHRAHDMNVEYMRTANVFGPMSGNHPKNINNVNAIKQMCETLGYSTEHRGDIMMFLSGNNF